MIDLKIGYVETIISFDDSESIKTLSISSLQIYYQIYLLFKSGYEDSFYLTENNSKKVFFKNVSIISDIFQLTENDKNNLKLLYANVDKNLSTKQSNLVSQIDTLAGELMFDISFNSNKKMEYEVKTKASDILSLYRFRFSEENNKSFFMLFLNYLKCLKEIKNSILIITFDFLHYFDEYHINLLREELLLYDIKLLDIRFIDAKKAIENIDDIFVDNDLCEY